MAEEDTGTTEEKSTVVSGGISKVLTWIIPIMVVIPLVGGLFTGNASINWDIFTSGGTDLIWRIMPVLITIIAVSYGQSELLKAGGKQAAGIAKIVAPIAIITAIAGIFIEGTGTWSVTAGIVVVMVVIARVMAWRKKKAKYDWTSDGERRDPNEAKILRTADEHGTDIRKGGKAIKKALKAIEKEKDDLEKALTGAVKKPDRVLAAGTGVAPGAGTVTLISADKATGEFSYTGQKPWKPITEVKGIVYKDPIATTEEIIGILENIKEKDKADEKKKDEASVIDRGEEILDEYPTLVQKISDLYLQGCVLVWEKYWVRTVSDMQKLGVPGSTPPAEAQYMVFDRYKKNDVAKNSINKILEHCKDALEGIQKMQDGLSVVVEKDAVVIGDSKIDGSIELVGSAIIGPENQAENVKMGKYKTDGGIDTTAIVTAAPLRNTLTQAIGFVKNYIDELKKAKVKWADEWKNTDPYKHPSVLEEDPPATPGHPKVLNHSAMLESKYRGRA